MKFQKVNIATARIKGLKKSPYYFDHHCYYAWDIMFEDTSTLFFYNLPFIKVGNTEEEGEVFCNQLKENFNEAHIYDGDKVAVIFGDDGRVLAIGNTGEDAWIDTTDKFVKKTFAELNIVITSLKVYWFAIIQTPATFSSSGLNFLLKYRNLLNKQKICDILYSNKSNYIKRERFGAYIFFRIPAP